MPVLAGTRSEAAGFSVIQLRDRQFPESTDSYRTSFGRTGFDKHDTNGLGVTAESRMISREGRFWHLFN